MILTNLFDGSTRVKLSTPIRKLKKDDVFAYHDLRLQALERDNEAYFSTADEVKNKPLSYFESEIWSNPESTYGYYGYFCPTLSAYICLQKPYFSKQHHTAEIFNLYVDSACRRRGIARELVEFVIQKVKQETKIEALFLSVMASNTAAQALYKKAGFVEYAIKEHSLKVGDRYFDEVFMRLDLPAQLPSASTGEKW